MFKKYMKISLCPLIHQSVYHIDDTSFYLTHMDQYKSVVKCSVYCKK